MPEVKVTFVFDEIYMEKLFDFNYAMEAARAIIKGRQRDEAFAG